MPNGLGLSQYSFDQSLLRFTFWNDERRGTSRKDRSMNAVTLRINVHVHVTKTKDHIK
jgi:hypothetical protein